MARRSADKAVSILCYRRQNSDYIRIGNLALCHKLSAENILSRIKHLFDGVIEEQWIFRSLFGYKIIQKPLRL